MSTAAAQQRNPSEEADYWIKYIDCALAHPRPLPTGTHPFSVTHDMKPELRDMYHCLYKLYTEESCSVAFREPVNALTLGVLNYYDVVRQPMSLRVVLDRIAAAEHYSTAQQVEEDVATIWNNCATFNGASSPVTAASRECAARLSAIQKAHREEEPASEAEVSSIVKLYEQVYSVEMANAFTAYFKRADPQRLANDEVDLGNLQRKHVPELLRILEQFPPRT